MELLRLKENNDKTISILKQPPSSILPEELLNEKIKFIKSGLNHTIIVTKENNIYVNGNNNYGQCLINQQTSSLFSKELDSKFYKFTEMKFNNITNVECCENFTIIVNNYNELYFSDSFYIYGAGIGDFIGYLSKNKKLSKIILNEINEEIILMRSNKRMLYILTKSDKLYKLYFSVEHYNKFEDRFKLIKIENNFFKIKDIQCESIYTLLLDKYGNLFFNKDNKNSYGKNKFFLMENYGDLSNVEFTKINFTKTLQILSEKKNKNNFFILTETNEIFNYKQNNSFEFQFTKIILTENFTKNLIQEIYLINQLLIIKYLNNNNLFTFNYESAVTFNNELFVAGDLNWKNIYPFLFDLKIYFLTTNDYKINRELEREDNDYFFLNNLYNTLLNNKLTDISFDECTFGY